MSWSKKIASLGQDTWSLLGFLVSKHNEAFDLKLFLLTKTPVIFWELSGYFFQHGFNFKTHQFSFLKNNIFPSHLYGKWLLILFVYIFLSKIIN